VTHPDRSISDLREKALREAEFTLFSFFFRRDRKT
jgi:hypothetical protein